MLVGFTEEYPIRVVPDFKQVFVFRLERLLIALKYQPLIRYNEIGRVELCRAMGFEYREMELQDKVLLTVAEVTCRYLSPARYDEEVIVKTWVERAHLRLVTFGYQMRSSADERKLAKGTTTHIFCTPDLTPARLPEKYWAKFGITMR